MLSGAAVMTALGQNLTPTPAPLCLLPPGADITPRWFWTAMCHNRCEPESLRVV